MACQEVICVARLSCSILQIEEGSVNATISQAEGVIEFKVRACIRACRACRACASCVVILILWLCVHACVRLCV
jgi:hypothetical protein